MLFKSSVALVLVAWFASVHCHTYYLGSCPRVEPMNDFDIEKVNFKSEIVIKT